MMTLTSFEGYISSQLSLPVLSHYYINGQEEQLLTWAATLPMQSEEEQVSQLEKVLTELWLIDVEDRLRLSLMGIVMTAADRLIANVRRHYIYETDALTASHQQTVNKIKSLYYLIVLVYDGVIRRTQPTIKETLKDDTTASIWKHFALSKRAQLTILAVAVYQVQLTYQKILYESSFCYQKPPQHLWSALNQLYRLACQYDIAHVDLQAHVVTRQADSIHQLYCQSCLHDLLNVIAMRRPSILLVQRLLPEWVMYISATLEPRTKTRIFVNLGNNSPPEYLTVRTPINPYDENYQCLFIELEPLATYFEQRKRALSAQGKGNETTEYRLVTNMLLMITYRYIKRQTIIRSKYATKQRAIIRTGFDSIHYQVANKQRLTTLIAAQELPDEYVPRYDTAPNKKTTPSALAVEIHESIDTRSRFKILRLLTTQDIAEQQAQAVEDAANDQKNHPNSSWKTDVDLNKLALPPDVESIDRQHLLTAVLPRLQTMSLVLLCETEGDKESMKLSVVRWLTLNDEYIEIESQILSHKPTACALRLDSRDKQDTRGQHFIPALLLVGETALETTLSLIVPSYHFRAEDNVILRLNNEQTSVRLQKSVFSTDKFTQYNIVRL